MVITLSLECTRTYYSRIEENLSFLSYLSICVVFISTIDLDQIYVTMTLFLNVREADRGEFFHRNIFEIALYSQDMAL